MKECWYALALALLSKDYYTPETAFDVLYTGVKRKLKNTDADIQDMIELHKTKTYIEIAKLYGIDKMTVWRKVNKKPVIKKQANADVVNMIKMKETMTYRQIGAIYGVTGQAIYKKIKKEIKL